MKLSKLIKELDILTQKNFNDIEITNLCINSKAILCGDLFICIKGNTADGHNYIREAEINGAKAIVCEKILDTNLPQIVVKDSRNAMSILSQVFFDYPSKKLKMIGITGTNGKTSTSYLIKNIFEYKGYKTGIIGTLGIYYANKEIAPELTTPDPICLNRILADMVAREIKYVVMEVSAHAIFYNKIDGIEFEVGIFSNFTQDHLDFFKDMATYKQVKKSFFNSKYIKTAILNFDDEVGREIAKTCNMPFITYGIDNPSDVFAVNIEQSIGGISYLINFFDELCEINLRLLGKFNVYNSISAIICAKLFNISFEDIAISLIKLSGIAGRLEYINSFNGGEIFVDFAHTPDGLQNCLNSIKELNPKRVMCLFGCGGNRDKLKRKIMGEISGELSNFTIVTSDNPRYEDPLDIINEIELGLKKHTKNYVTIQDRYAATEYAINLLREGDILLIAGKGAENYQEIMGIKHIYNDKNIINNIITGKKNE